MPVHDPEHGHLSSDLRLRSSNPSDPCEDWATLSRPSLLPSERDILESLGPAFHSIFIPN